MSLTRCRPERAARPNVLRDLATQAAAHPRIEAAVLGAIRAELPAVIEGLLRQMYAGEQVRLYVPKGAGRDARSARDQRILAARGAEPAAAVASREGVSVRRVQQLWAGAADAKSSA